MDNRQLALPALLGLVEKQRQLIAQQMEILSNVVNGTGALAAGESVKPKRHMSAAGRKRISAASKMRWKKWAQEKAQQEKANKKTATRKKRAAVKA